MENRWVVFVAMKIRGTQKETSRSATIENRYPPLLEPLLLVGKPDGALLLNAMKNVIAVPMPATNAGNPFQSSFHTPRCNDIGMPPVIEKIRVYSSVKP